MALLARARVRAAAVRDQTAARLPGGWALLIAIVAWLIALALVGKLVHGNLTNPARYRLEDLNVYRNGGATMLRGGPLYSVEARELLFTYPPLAAVLAMPLALISWPAAQLVWVAFIYVPLAIAIWFGFRPLLARARDYAPAVFAGLFLTGAYLLPLRQEIYYGQVDMVLVALCLLDLGTRRPRWPRGLLIGLATAVKLVPGVFIVYLLVTGRRTAAAVAALTFAALTGLAWLISPQDSHRYWTSAIFDSGRLGPNRPAANQSLRGMLLRQFYPTTMPAAVWIALAVVVAGAGYAAARIAQRRGSELAGVAIVGLLATLLSPVAWIHHLCWAVVALGVITGDGRSPRRVATAAIATLLFISNMSIWGQELVQHVAAVPPVVDRLIEDTFGLAAIVLIVVIAAIRPTDADTGPALADPGPGAGSASADQLLLAGRHDG